MWILNGFFLILIYKDQNNFVSAFYGTAADSEIHSSKNFLNLTQKIIFPGQRGNFSVVLHFQHRREQREWGWRERELKM